MPLRPDADINIRSEKRTLSYKLFVEALKLIPGGVNSPVRAFRAVGGNPFFIQRGKGSNLYDVDGNEYLDYVCTWGPSILGHAHPAILHAISEQLQNGISFGTPHLSEVEMARLIVQFYPSIKKVRMCNSGTEATMSCVRLARGFTGRDLIIKFEGCYHGHGDSLLVKAGSGALTTGQPDSAGVPADLARLTITLPFNDHASINHALNKHGRDIAAIILEPIPANAGLYLPKPDYLEFLRRITHEYGILLIFDEVMTGFRVAFGGAQEIYHIQPDLTALGKIIGGGLPVGAFGGAPEIMDYLAPIGPVYQAGTLSGNPLTLAAGLANLKQLISPSIEISNSYRYLEQRGSTLEAGVKDIARKAKIPVQFQRIGSMFCTYFNGCPVYNLKDAEKSDTTRFAHFFHGMLQRGIYLPPSQFETSFISIAHSEEDIETTLRAAKETFHSLSLH